MSRDLDLRDPRDARAMTTLRRISRIDPIPGADRIEAAGVDGWKAVVRKGAFAVGEPVLYVEIDGFMPLDPRFGLNPDVAIEWDGRRGHRLFTMTMRGQISRGLVLKPDLFPELAPLVDGRTPEELAGIDLSGPIGVVKWEATIPAEIAHAVIGALPSRIGSTSLPRLQNLPDLFRDHAGRRAVVSLKVDGVSAHVFRLDGRVRVGCGNWELRERPGEPVWAAARARGLVEAMERFGEEGWQVQAEAFGMDMRAGYHEGRTGSHLAVFHMRDNLAGRDMSLKEQDMILLTLFGSVAPRIERAPILGVVDLDDYAGRPEALFELAEGPSIDPRRRREGIVLRTLDGSFAFKVISNRKLAKEGGGAS